MAMTQAKLVEAIEALVDSETLQGVLIAAHLVCIEKAEHLRINWQDEITAKVWDRAATATYKVANNPSVETVS